MDSWPVCDICGDELYARTECTLQHEPHTICCVECRRLFGVGAYDPDFLLRLRRRNPPRPAEGKPAEG